MTRTDPYFDGEHGLLRNRLGIVDPIELKQVEAELTALRLVELQEEPLPGSYDLVHLQALHRFIFGDVYDWAGELRTVSIGKGDVFCLPQFIEPYAADVFGGLASKNYLRFRKRAEFLDGLADLLPMSTLCTRSGRATVERSGRSWLSWLPTRVGCCDGRRWTRTRTCWYRSVRTAATAPRYVTCSTA